MTGDNGDGGDRQQRRRRLLRGCFLCCARMRRVVRLLECGCTQNVFCDLLRAKTSFVIRHMACGSATPLGRSRFGPYDTLNFTCSSSPPARLPCHHHMSDVTVYSKVYTHWSHPLTPMRNCRPRSISSHDDRGRRRVERPRGFSLRRLVLHVVRQCASTRGARSLPRGRRSGSGGC